MTLKHGRIVLHQSLQSVKSLQHKLARKRMPYRYRQALVDLPESQRWTIRNVVDHPVDPWWERGVYCVCHQKLREKLAHLLASHETWLFDSVYHRKCRKYVIRSAFQITGFDEDCRRGKKGPDLTFNDYYFAGKSPITLRKQPGRGYGSVAEGSGFSNLRKQVREAKYEHCRNGTRPRIIPEEAWEAMKWIARAAHTCPM